MPSWKTLEGPPTSSRCIVPISFLSLELTLIGPGVIWHRWKRKTAQPRSPDLSMARRKGFEPLTPRFEVWCSIQLSYRRLQESRQYLLRRGFTCQTAENRGRQQAVAGQVTGRN